MHQGTVLEPSIMWGQISQWFWWELRGMVPTSTAPSLPRGIHLSKCKILTVVTLSPRQLPRRDLPGQGEATALQHEGRSRLGRDGGSVESRPPYLQMHKAFSGQNYLWNGCFERCCHDETLDTAMILSVPALVNPVLLWHGGIVLTSLLLPPKIFLYQPKPTQSSFLQSEKCVEPRNMNSLFTKTETASVNADVFQLFIVTRRCYYPLTVSRAYCLKPSLGRARACLCLQPHPTFKLGKEKKINKLPWNN